MLPTFVIGLREGLEASLIVSIVATFLYQRGRRDLLRWVFAGVALAVLLCAGVGVALQVVSRDLPQRQQEGLETVIGVVAVAMVTYMVVWMRRHSRNLKGQLEGAAAEALAAGSGMALVVMAFLAVMREGFETAVFLLATFNESSSGASAWIGAILGILVAVGLGYAIFRGGVRLNLSKFFRGTGVVLVLVAAGLVVNAVHTAHEAGWLNLGQDQVADLTAVVRPGSVQSSLLTGMLGIQERPTVVELLAWLLYLVPVGLYVAWPPGRGLRAVARRRLYAGVAGASLTIAAALVVLAPASPGPGAVRLADRPVKVIQLSGQSGAVMVGEARKEVSRTGTERVGQLDADTYLATSTDRTAAGPARLTLRAVADANGGRLPLGAAPSGTDFGRTVPVSYATVTTSTFWIEPRTRQVLDYRTSEQRQVTALLATGPMTVVAPAAPATSAAPAEVATAASAAQHALTARTQRQNLLLIAGALLLCALAGSILWLASRPRPTRPQASSPTRSAELSRM